MFQLYIEDPIQVWKESARWLKFEERVEDGGGVFSAPHVAALSHKSMADLQQLFAKENIIESDAQSFDELVDKLVELLETSDKSKAAKVLKATKVHQFNAKKR